MPHRPKQFELPRLIVCEGPDDKSFFRHLILNRGIQHFHIEDASPAKSKSGGNTMFGRKLKALKNNRLGFEKIRQILIVSDNDTDQQASFSKIVTQLANNGFPAPTKVLEPVGNNPMIRIMMLPLENEPGNLESACKAAAASMDMHISQCVDNFCAVSLADGWPPERYAKLWLRASLSARYDRDPFIFLGSAFATGLVPFDHNSFDEICEVLNQL